MEINLFELFFNLLQLLSKWATIVYDFLFTETTFGFQIKLLDIDWQFSFIPFFAIGGGLVVTLITMRLIKLFIPVA